VVSFVGACHSSVAILSLSNGFADKKSMVTIITSCPVTKENPIFIVSYSWVDFIVKMIICQIEEGGKGISLLAEPTPE